MRTPIKLDSTVFDFSQVVGNLEEDLSRWLTVKFKGKMTKMMDFGSVLIGPAADHPDVQWFIAESPTTVSTFFSAPVDWRMPQLLKALGAFKSAGEAKRNGWDKDIPDGWSQHVVRIGHGRGAIHVLKLTAECACCGALMTSDAIHTCDVSLAGVQK